MRAAILRELGGVPELGEVADPPGDAEGEPIEVTAAGLNPVDLFIATGNMARVKPEPPAVLGLEGTGTRADGTRVYFGDTVGPYGSFAERAVARPGSVVELPDGIDDATALCFGIAGLAGWLAVAWRGKLEAGETVVVLGASGMVGRVAVQAAKLLGAGRVIAAARNEEALSEVAGLGADATVPIAGEGLAEALRDAAPDGIDLIVDPVWGPAAMAAIDAASQNARLIQVGNASGPVAELAAPPFRNKHISLIGHTNFAVPDDGKNTAFRRMCEHAAAGELHVEAEEIPLERIADAWKRQAESPGRKLVLKI
jgi:NADPH:quinone reductase-like Zn-dependent oxidoreductase